MADYYSLIKKAVARLDSSAHESRRSLYERARAAQLNQLRSISPPLSKTEIIGEQLALEEALRRVEAEISQHGRNAAPTTRDLVIAANDIGSPISHVDRPSGLRAKVVPPPFSSEPPVDMLPLMVLKGGATGRLVRYWRWRAVPPRSAGSKRASQP